MEPFCERNLLLNCRVSVLEEQEGALYRPFMFPLVSNTFKKQSFHKQIESKDACNKTLKSNDLKIAASVLNGILPNGLSEEIWCATNNKLTEKNCLTDSGSPVILSKDSTARGQYFEQQFILGPLL